jgi:hypothetical protein
MLLFGLDAPMGLVEDGTKKRLCDGDQARKKRQRDMPVQQVRQ